MIIPTTLKEKMMVDVSTRNEVRGDDRKNFTSVSQRVVKERMGSKTPKATK